MDDEQAGEWLDDWIEQNVTTPGHRESAADMADEEAACRLAANKAGIEDEQLDRVAFGSLAAYLLEEQNALKYE